MCLVIFPICNCNMRTNFSKFPQYKASKKILSQPGCSVRTDTKKLMVACHSRFANAPKTQCF